MHGLELTMQHPAYPVVWMNTDILHTQPDLCSVQGAGLAGVHRDCLRVVGYVFIQDYNIRT